MANQIVPDDHNASDWFWTDSESAARGIAIIFIYRDQQPL